MLRNYLKGTGGDQINILMAASASNMMKWMRLNQQDFFIFIFRLDYQAFIFNPVNIQR